MDKMSNQADRNNSGKPELSYILEAPRAMTSLAELLTFGGKKYARKNWQKGFPKEQLIDSLMRHLMKYANGELLDYDPECQGCVSGTCLNHSGLPHITAVMCNAMFLAECELRGDYATLPLPDDMLDEFHDMFIKSLTSTEEDHFQ